MLQMRDVLAAAVVAAGVLAAGAMAWAEGDAKGWRTDGTGIYADAKVVTEWGPEKNVRWKVATETWSNATPVVVGDKIFIEAEKDQLLCLSAADGKVLWKAATGYGEADVKPTWEVKTHDVNGFTSPTPACDGRTIVLMNGYGMGAGFDLEGKRLWIRLIGTPGGERGNSSSPVLVDGLAVMLLNGNAYGIEAATGKELWKTPSKAHWGSMVVARVGGEAVAITPEGDFLRVKDGKKLASTPIAELPPGKDGKPKQGKVTLNYNAPLVADGVVYFMCGELGCRAYQLPATLAEDRLELKELWHATIGKPDRTYSSPVLWEGVAYVINQKGWLSAFDAATGKVLWEQDMKVGGTAYPSLVIAGTADGPRLLVSGDSGTTAVLVPGKAFQEVGRNKLENFRTTPVCVGDRVYIRTLKNLWCLGK